MALETFNPTGFAFDELYRRDLVIGDLPNGTSFIGANGVISSTASNCTLFDCRPYRQLLLCVQIGALTGGTTPSVQWMIAHHCDSDATVFELGDTTETIPATGGGLVVAAGIGSAYNSAGVAFFNGKSAGCPFVPPYMRIRYFVSGGAGWPGGITAPSKLRLYGVR